MNDQTYLIDDFNQAYLHDASQQIMDLYANLNPYKQHTVEEEDNDGNIIRRPLFSHSSLGNREILNLKGIKLEDYDEKHNTSYIVLIHHHQELAAANLQIIPDKILDYVRVGKCKLILDNTLEGDQVWDFYPILYKSLEILKLPPSQIYYITNNLVAEKLHNVYLKNNSQKNSINVISYMWNVTDTKRLIHEGALPPVVNIEEEIQYKREQWDNVKTFLKVNRTGRIQRNLMMLFFNKFNLIDKSLISYPKFHKEDMNSWGHGTFKSLLDNDNIDSLKKQIPFDIDNTDETNHGDPGYEVGQFNADLPFQSIHYRNTFISVVMCAFPEVPGACHLHSSTFNPMYCGHPIIQYGPYRALKVLKERGFKTFDKWWDESYDEIENDWKRLKAVMDILLEVSKKSTTELFNMYVDMKDVLQHNINVMKNYSIDKELKYRIYEQ